MSEPIRLLPDFDMIPDTSRALLDALPDFEVTVNLHQVTAEDLVRTFGEEGGQQ